MEIDGLHHSTLSLSIESSLLAHSGFDISALTNVNILAEAQKLVDQATRQGVVLTISQVPVGHAMGSHTTVVEVNEANHVYRARLNPKE